MSLRVSVIVAAAGLSKRFSPTEEKQFVEIAGKPMLTYCLETFESSDEITGVVVVVPAGSVSRAQKIVNRSGLKKVVAVVAGGEKRQISVRNGFDATPKNTDIVIIHDAARPFVTCDIIERIIHNSSYDDGVATCVLPVTDTLKRVDITSQSVLETVSREGLFRAQTPQAFRYSVLAEIYSHYDSDIKKPETTDEAQLAEVYGTKVTMVVGSEVNFKVTTIEDLALAKLIASTSLWRSQCTE